MPHTFQPAATVAPRYEAGALGLPARAIPITNSERKAAWCDRRWHYGYGLNMKSGGNAAMARGRWTHEALEALFRYFQASDSAVPSTWPDDCPLCTLRGVTNDDCEVCGGTGSGIVQIAIAAMLDDASQSAIDFDAEAEAARLEAMLLGYVERWGAFPLDRWKVVDVERAFAAPILSPKSGKVYRSRLPVVQCENGWRLAGSHDAANEIEHVWIPFYQLGRLDAVLRHRDSGDLLVHEFKTSANPTSFARDLHLDTQIPGYMRLLEYGKQFSKSYADAERVVGYQYDVIGSKGWSRPSVLKSGKLSSSARTQANVPSWAWRETLLDEDLRAKHTDEQWTTIEALASDSELVVDPKLYCREFGTFDAASLRRFEIELYADATRFAAMRRAAARKLDDDELAAHFPRTPVCRIMGHGCDFVSLCLNDSSEAHGNFAVRDAVRWVAHVTEDTSNNPNHTEISCPF